MTPTIAIVDYGSGNLRSVVHALERLGFDPLVTRNPLELGGADAYVLPGVGAFAQAMSELRARDLIKPLTDEVMGKGKPFLGICLGMQLLAEDSTEGGHHQGLGWIKGSHVVSVAAGPGLRVPHVGWNELTVTQPAPLFAALGSSPSFYFDHGYHLVCDDADVAARFEYGRPMVAALQRGNLFAVQFHPERGQVNGLRLLRRFTNHVAALVQAA